MSAPLSLILATLLALPSVAFAQAEEEVVSAISGRLDAARRNDVAAWVDHLLSQVADRDARAPRRPPAVARHGGRSHSAGTGGGDAAKWLPENDTTFFVPGEAAGGDSSRLIFVKKVK